VIQPSKGTPDESESQEEIDMNALEITALVIATIIIWINLYQWFYSKMSKVLTRVTDWNNFFIFILAPAITPFIALHKALNKLFTFLDKE
jgi:hypothetical protein